MEKQQAYTLTIDYGFTTRSYPITQIMFQAEDGTSVATYTPDGYVVDGLTVPHNITIDQVQAPQVPQVQPNRVTMPQVPRVRTTQVEYETVPQYSLRPGELRPPPVVKVGQTGRISGLGATYNDEGKEVRRWGTYRFTVERVLRNGSNVVIRVEDGHKLTLRWRTHSQTTGRGWTVKTGKTSYDLVDVQLD